MRKVFILFLIISHLAFAIWRRGSVKDDDNKLVSTGVVLNTFGVGYKFYYFDSNRVGEGFKIEYNRDLGTPGDSARVRFSVDGKPSLVFFGVVSQDKKSIFIYSQNCRMRDDDKKTILKNSLFIFLYE
jgi:hypothetical protein